MTVIVSPKVLYNKSFSLSKRIQRLLLIIIITIIFIHLTWNDYIPNYTKRKVLETKKTPTPVCLISSWDRGKFPDYAMHSVQSLAINGNYTKLFIFHHNTTGIPTDDEYPHVQWVDIAKISPTYRRWGFPKFLADRVCQIFHKE